MNVLFLNIGLFILIATLFALLTRLLKQPLIPGYILAGLFLGPIMGIISNTTEIEALADIGVAFLLFLVGMELNFTKLKQFGGVILIGGTIQNILMTALGYLIGLALGFSALASVYFAFICAFSSTMVLIKILVDKGELDTLHGKMVIGFLLMEDFFALLALSSLNIMSHFSPILFFVVIFKLFLLLLVAYIFNKYVILPLFEYSSNSQEISFFMALSSAFFFTLLFQFFGKILVAIANKLNIVMSTSIESVVSPGVSIAIAAFIAGMGLGTSKYAYNVIGKIGPLRDFFATLFFVSLGIGFTLTNPSGILVPVIVLLLITLVLKPILNYFLVYLWGYTKRTAFNTAIYLTQISEFSLIILTMGISQGIVDDRLYSVVVIVAIITLTISAYLTKFSTPLFSLFLPILRILGKIPQRDIKMEFLPKNPRKEVLLIGYDRIGYSIFNTLRKLKKNFLVVDYNPDIIKTLIEKRIHCLYGDILNPEIMARVKIDKAKIIISTVPDIESNKAILGKTKQLNPKAIVIVTTYDVEESLVLYEAGADYVIIPHILGGHHMSYLIEKFDKNIKHLVKTRVEHITELKKRSHLHHHYLHHKKARKAK